MPKGGFFKVMWSLPIFCAAECFQKQKKSPIESVNFKSAIVLPLLLIKWIVVPLGEVTKIHDQRG